MQRARDEVSSKSKTAISGKPVLLRVEGKRWFVDPSEQTKAAFSKGWRKKKEKSTEGSWDIRNSITRHNRFAEEDFSS